MPTFPVSVVPRAKITVIAAHPPPERPFSVVEKPEEEAAASAETIGCVFTEADWRLLRTGVALLNTRRAERSRLREIFMVAEW